MLILPLFAALAAGADAQPAPSPIDGWQIQEANSFCYLSLSAAGAAGTELGIALDTGDKAKIVLSHDAWKLQPDRSYRVEAGLDGAVKPRKARGMRLGSDWVAVVADVDDHGFIEQFAASKSLRFKIQKLSAGPGEGNYQLADADAAAKALRSCQAKLKIRTQDLAKLKVDRETNFRTDYQAEEEAATAAEQGN